MNSSNLKIVRFVPIIRWIARAWSVLSILTLLFPFFMEGLIWMYANSLREVLGHICYMGILIGLILSWFREGLGGTITSASLVLFYLVFIVAGRIPTGAFLVLIAVPGFLFLMTWLLTTMNKKNQEN